MPNTYLSKTYSGNGNLKKGTISVWVKFGDTGASADSAIFGTGNTSNDSDFTMLTVNGNGISGIVTRNVMFVLRKSGGTVYEATSNLLIRDTSAWYHIVARYDTTLSTPNCDIYVNGEEVTYEGEDLLGRVLQHEYDHLQGQLLLKQLNRKVRKEALKEISIKGFPGDKI